MGMRDRAFPLYAVSIVACLIVVGAALGGCGKTSGGSTTNGESSDAGSAATPLGEVEEGDLTIGLSNFSAFLPFEGASKAGVEEQAAKYGWKVVETDSGFDPSKQVSDVQSLITRGVDVLIVSPVDKDALLPAYQAAAEAQIPIVSIGNKLDAKDAGFETAFFGNTNEEIGSLETEALIEAMGGKGKVIMVLGPSGTSFVTEMAAGAEKTFAEHPEIEVVFKQNTKALSSEEGLRVAQTALTAHPDVQGVWANEDELAAGSVRALQERGLAGKVPVGWNGGTAPSLEAAAKGEMVGVVLPSYTWGADTVKLIHEAISEGKEFSGGVDAPNIILESAAEAKKLLSQCPQEPNQIWCIGG